MDTRKVPVYGTLCSECGNDITEEQHIDYLPDWLRYERCGPCQSKLAARDLFEGGGVWTNALKEAYGVRVFSTKRKRHCKNIECDDSRAIYARFRKWRTEGRRKRRKRRENARLIDIENLKSLGGLFSSDDEDNSDSCIFPEMNPLDADENSEAGDDEALVDAERSGEEEDCEDIDAESKLMREAALDD